MTARHTAALALVGWYLLTPRLGPDGKLQTDAPYARWYYNGSYDTAAQCEDERDTLATTTKVQGTVEERRKFHKAFAESQCISTDDPRLAK